MLEMLFDTSYGLAHHPFLLLILWLLALVLTGKLDAYGIGDLFFQVSLFQRIWVGLALGFLVQTVLVAGFLLGSKPAIPMDTAWWISVLSGLGLTLALAAFFVREKLKYLFDEGRTAKENRLSLAMFLGFLLSWGLSGLCCWRFPGGVMAQLNVWFVMGAAIALFAIHAGMALIGEERLTPAVPLCVLLMGAVAVYLAFALQAPFGASLLVLAIWLASSFAGWNRYKYGLVEMQHRKRECLRTVVDEKCRCDPFALPPEEESDAAPRYRDGVPMEHDRTKPFVILCTSGGGIKAAAWTVTALRAIHRRVPDFHRHVRIITGASGGMVGAGFYVEALARAQAQQRAIDFSALYDRVTRDMLSKVVHRMIFRDLVLYPFPFAHPNNRGQALEETWPELQTLSFGQLLTLERNGIVPSLVYSPMMVEDGRRLLIANLDLWSCSVNRAPMIGTGSEPKALLSVSGFEYGRLFSPEELDRLRVSTAARLSATFPYVTPAVSLPTVPRRRVVDAGYYDNFGVSLAVDWVRTHRNWLRANARCVVIVQLRCSMDEMQRQARFDRDSAPGSALAAGWEWLTSPIEGILSAREAGMSFRNDEMLEGLSCLLSGMAFERTPEGGAQGSMPFFSTVLLECNVSAPLSWRLTRRQRIQLRQFFHRQGAGNDATNLQQRLEQLALRLRASEPADRLDHLWRREGAMAENPSRTSAVQQNSIPFQGRC